MLDADPVDPTMTHRPRTPQRHQGADPRRSAWRALLSVLLAVIVISGSAALGVLFVELASQRVTVSSEPTATPTPLLPAVDVDGHDVRDLGRYPGSVRTAYLREPQGSTTVTAIEYAVSAEQDAVRAFYRRMFREHEWTLIELDVSGGDWIFLVEKGRRAAFVQIDERGSHVAIEIELERTARAPNRTPAPTPPPARPPPPPPPGDDDDDDDD